jgi:Oligosaccharyltransferase 48 kDa subunit beta
MLILNFFPVSLFAKTLVVYDTPEPSPSIKELFSTADYFEFSKAPSLKKFEEVIYDTVVIVGSCDFPSVPRDSESYKTTDMEVSAAKQVFVSRESKHLTVEGLKEYYENSGGSVIFFTTSTCPFLKNIFGITIEPSEEVDASTPYFLIDSSSDTNSLAYFKHKIKAAKKFSKAVLPILGNVIIGGIFKNSRMLLLSSSQFIAKPEILSDLILWAKKRKNIRKLDFFEHHKVSESSRPRIYTESDTVSVKVRIVELTEEGDWIPHISDSLQLEISMLDPYVRVKLTHSKDGVYETVLQLPDKAGIFKFRVFDKLTGWNEIHEEDIIGVRNYKHNDYPRFHVVAYPWYISVFASFAGFLVFAQSYQKILA